MTQVFTLLGFVSHLEAVLRAQELLPHAVLDRACQMVAIAARNRLGKNHRDWQTLAPATIADRVRQGFAPNEPGLRTGAMRDSIQYTIAPNDREAEVGSNDQHLVWFELGTSKQPPRSVLVAAAQSVEDRIYKMAARATVAVLEGRGLRSSEFENLIHLLEHAAESVKENLASVIFGEDQDNEESRR